MIISRKRRGGQLKVGFNDDAIAEAKKYFCYFALASNQTMKTFTVLENYRLREKVEELFAVKKGKLDGARPCTWYPDNLRGRQFVQFIALCYHCFLTKKIKEMRATLGSGEPGKQRHRSNLKESWTSSLSNAPWLKFWIGLTASRQQAFRHK